MSRSAVVLSFLVLGLSAGAGALSPDGSTDVAENGTAPPCPAESSAARHLHGVRGSALDDTVRSSSTTARPLAGGASLDLVKTRISPERELRMVDDRIRFRSLGDRLGGRAGAGVSVAARISRDDGGRGDFRFRALEASGQQLSRENLEPILRGGLSTLLAGRAAAKPTTIPRPR